MIEAATVFRKCSDARYRNIGGEGVVVRQTVGEVLVLNEVGVQILDLLATGNPVHRVVEALAADYEVDAATAERDVLGYARELLEAGVIEQLTA
jgi:hypothetical protein